MPAPSSPHADVPDIVVQAAARLLAEGRAAEAATRLDALTTAAPAYPTALVLLARALEAAGRDAEALAAWHRAHFLVPNSPLVRRERQRLLEALAAAPLDVEEAPAEEDSGEPAATGVEAGAPEALESADVLASAPAGDLPDAHLALTSEAPAGEAALEEEDGEPQAAETEAVEAAWNELLDAPDAAGKDEAFAEETAAEAPAEEAATAEAAVEEEAPVQAEPEDVVEAPEAPEEVLEEEVAEPAAAAEEPAPAVGVESEPPIAAEPCSDVEPVAEVDVAPPDVVEVPAEPVAGEPESEAAWWQRTAAPEAPPAEEDEAGWAVLEETETPPSGPAVAEPRVTAPGEVPEATEPEQGEEEPGVEEARVIAADAPAEEESGPGGPPPTDELDALIRQLEGAARIRPDPTFQSADVSVDDDEVDDDMVSETLARIYAAQRQYAEAAIVYEKLAQQRPEQADELLQRAAEMRAQGDG